MNEATTTLFVRGKYQLARCEPGSSATGRRLTEHEVLQAYGPEVIAEIDDQLSAVLLARTGAIEHAIGEQREALGVTRAELARAANVDREIVERAETNAEELGLRELEHLAFVLGLDPAKLSIDERAGSDPELGVRLRVLEVERVPTPTSARLTPRTVLRFSEAASIIRSQLLLQDWLEKQSEAARFEASPNYGPPAWRAGYALARQARDRLGISLEPIESMLDLVESRLGIPIIQVPLPPEIAGATISTQGQRGIVLNVDGRNENVWIRRTTLAHELGHILFDPEEQLANVRVDSYEQIARDAEHDSRLPDYVEQRANAFAVEFLAPREAVRQLVPSPAQVSATSVERVMSDFGIGRAAARFHVGNAWWGEAELPDESTIQASPRDDQRAAEDFTLHFFEPSVTPDQRRGRFAFLVAEAVDVGLITPDTAAQYLACTENEIRSALPVLLDLA
ncbi:MAG: ImmA/IrrE family metallo-endopeptidase [Anaerolineaceae bacterium]|nr:ImmA/IrrE family metallo-endopeptidase [Anaerolineaceae bacterium]